MARAYGFVALAVMGSFGVAVSSMAVSGVQPRDTRAQMVKTAEARPVAPPETVDEDTLRRKETITELLERSPLDAETVRSVLNQIEALHDVRRVRPGLVIRYTMAAAGMRRAELELNADHTLVVERTVDGTEGRIEETAVRPETIVLAGTVRSSLSQALADAGSELPRVERDQLADLLADQIFAWKMDFSRDLHPGHRFRIVYERMARPDGTARDGRVLAARFDLGDQVQDAFLFDEDGVDEYYDSEGQSLRAAFLRAPLEYRRISSRFNRARLHPILNRLRAHQGTDYAADTGTPVRAVGDGVVTSAGYSGGYGNVLQLRHLRGYATRYAHLSGFAPGIRPGARVKQGDVVAFVGSTGLSTGPHLHFEFHSDGRAVDPASVDDVSGEPVPSAARARFRATVAEKLAMMEGTGAPRLASRATRTRNAE